MKYGLYIFLFLLVGCGSDVQPRPSGAPVFIGDSITAFWSQNGNSLPLPNAIDAGVPGRTTDDILSRFNTDVIAKSPAHVYILAGTNDVLLQHDTTLQTITNLNKMIAMAQAHGIAVTVGTVPPVDQDICCLGVQFAGKDFNPAGGRDTAA